MTDVSHYHVLLVEDNAANILVATTTLESLGYTHLTATSGMDALKTFLAHRFDVILMDIQMPMLSGIDTAELMRAIEKRLGTRTPIIAMTAHMHAADMSKPLEDDFDDFIPKPFHLDYFSKTLAKYSKPGSPRA